MTIDDVRMIIDKINDLRRQLGRAKMDISVGWIKTAINELDTLENQMLEFQRDVIAKKTIQVLNSSVEGVYQDE